MNRSDRVTPAAPALPDAAGMAEQFRTIVEIAGDVAFTIDCATLLPAYISPAVEQLLGYSADALRGQLAHDGAGGPLAALLAGLPERLRRLEAGDRSRQRVVREIELRGKSGQAVPVELISTVIAGAGGRPATLVGLVRDLSARRARDAEQKRFASMLNHEFRTPLSTIDGAIQRLEATGANADAATRGRYRKIAVAVDRLIGMLDDYLSPERMAEIGSERQPNTIAPRVLLEEAAAQARAACRRASIEQAGLPAALRCDPAGLRLVFKILIDNAIQYSPADTAILLSGRRAAGGIEFVVRNHGPGVAPEDTPRIFDKFYRGRNAAGLPGSGMGLYMARSVVEVHGGSLDLAGTADGAAFRLWLPAAGKKVAPGVSSSDNQDNNPTGKATGSRGPNEGEDKKMANP